MSNEFEAVYEDGVLKPLVPVPLVEHQRVKVIVQHVPSIARRNYGMIGWEGDPKVVEMLALGQAYNTADSFD